jgi:hypothetical protein
VADQEYKENKRHILEYQGRKLEPGYA